MALLTAVRLCREKNINNVVICSDLKFVLQSVGNTADPPNYIISTVQNSVCRYVNVISFLRTPGHASITGNEKADHVTG